MNVMNNSKCTIEWCDQPRQASKLICNEHYALWTQTRHIVEHLQGRKYWVENYRYYREFLIDKMMVEPNIYPAWPTAEQMYECLRNET